MSSKITPSNPAECMVIATPIPNVTTLSVPFLRFGRIKLGGRATLVKLQSGSYAVFSPVALTPAVQSLIAPSSVSHIIAPDMEHHIFLSAWSAAYPSAKLLGPSGLPEKRRAIAQSQAQADANITDVPFAVTWSAGNKASVKVDEAFDAEFEYEFVDAHSNKELVFFHKPSRTLIEADLLFNLPATEQYSKSGESATSGIFTRLFGALQTTKGDARWQKRLLWYGLSSGDRKGFNRSISRIDGWDFDNLIPCHGDSIVGGAKGTWRKVMEWHLMAAKKEAGAASASASTNGN